MMVFPAFYNSEREEKNPAFGLVTLLRATAFSHLTGKKKGKNVKNTHCKKKKILQLLHVDAHSYIFEFPHQCWPPHWMSLRGSPLPDSVFRTAPGSACRRRSRTQQAVWPAPSRTPPIWGGTAESCSGTDPAQCRSSGLGVFDSANHMTMQHHVGSPLIFFSTLLTFSDSWTHPSSVIRLLKVVVAESRRCPRHCLSIDYFLCVVPFTLKHLIAEGVLHFHLDSQKTSTVKKITLLRNY